MKRRRLLRGLAALAAGGTVAGCTNNREVPETAPELPVTETPRQGDPVPTLGSRPGQGAGDPPESPGPNGTRGFDVRTPTPVPFVNEGFEWIEADDGTLVVVLTVSNETPSDGAVTVLGTVTMDGEVHRDGVVAEIPEDGTRSVRLDFPVDYATFARRPSIDFDITDGRPDTPFPTDQTSDSTTDGTEARTAAANETESG